MALTLIEAAKLHSGNVLRAGVIELYAQNNDILSAMPFVDISGNAYSYTLEDTLPGIGFRGYNEGYAESTGILNPKTEHLVIAGGDVDVDRAILKTMGQDQRTSQESRKIKALAHKIGYTMIKGDSVTNAKEFDGLQTRITGSQLFPADAGTQTSGGDPLTLEQVDKAIDATDEATHLIMSKAMRRRFTEAARKQAADIGGHIIWTTDSWGRQVMKYNDLPILIADRNNSYYNTLAFDEVGPGGGTTSTSIYVVSLKEGMVQGIQNGAIEVEDLGHQHAKPVMRTRVEWLVGMGIFHPRAASRVWGISDAAIVAA